MKKNYTLFLLCISLFTFFKTSAQSPGYGTQWVIPSQKYLKFKIIKDGVYRIYGSTLSSAGWGGVPGSQYQLFNNGHEVALYLTNNSSLSSTDYIEFYARHNDGWADSALYAQPNHQPTTLFSLFTDTATYFLTYNSSSAHLRIADSTLSLSGHPAAENYFLYPQTQLYGNSRNYNYFWAGEPIIHNSSSNDLFNSRFHPGEGFFATNYIAAGSPAKYSNTFNTPHIYYSASSPITITGQVAGIFYHPSTHLIRISLNGNLVNTFTGYDYLTTNINCSTSSLTWITGSTSTVDFDNIGTPDAASDQYAPTNFTLEYPHTFDLDNVSTLLFNLQVATGRRYLKVFDYNRKNTSPVIYDLTNNWRITGRGLLDTGTFLLPATSGKRTLYLTTQDSTDIVTVKKLTAVSFTDYTNPTKQGDLIIIYNNRLRYDSANGNADLISQLATIKSNAGFKPILVDIMSLYDQFAYGIYLHPLSIRNFAHYINATWSTPVKDILLVGKGYEFDVILDKLSRDSVFTYNNCFIPTFGANTGPYYGNAASGSDQYMTATNTSEIPVVPIGRISLRNYRELRNYIQKVKDHHAAQFIGITNPQKPLNKQWQKNVLHLAGGSDYLEQAGFLAYLNTYKSLIAAPPIGAHVTTITKTTTAPVQLASAQLYDSLFNNGQSLVTFFGHSASSVLDFNITDPNSFSNKGKYPVLFACGCYNGTLFGTDTSLISEQLVKAQNRAAIAMIGAANLSQSGSLNTYAYSFYQAITHEAKGKTLGEIIQATITRASSGYIDPNLQLVLEQVTLNGDPSIRLFPDALPDYYIDSSYTRLIPSQITASTDSFRIMLLPQNIGSKAFDTMIYAVITRTFPDGKDTVYKKLFPAPLYNDTVSFTIKVGGVKAYGLNKFDIKINKDALTTIPEITQTNNETNINVFINGDDILPVWPYNFSIVNTTSPVLKGSTVNAFAPSETYNFEIDTTELFNSPVKQTGSVTQTGGVVHWLPAKNLTDSTVYYWRCAVNKVKPIWHTSSFIVLKAGGTGWNQSHYFQLNKDDYSHNILLKDSTRKFAYINNVKSLTAFTGTSTDLGGNLPFEKLNVYLNNTLLADFNQGYYQRFLIIAFDSASFNPMPNYPVGGRDGALSQSGKAICHNEHQQLENAFFFNTNSNSSTDASNINNMAALIDSIKPGSYIFGMSLNNEGISNWSSLSPALISKLHALNLHAMDTMKVFHPYIFFCQKGKASFTPKEIIGGSKDTSTAAFSINITKKWYKGFINSVTIGPAGTWSYFHWKHYSTAKVPTDISNVDIVGITNNGQYVPLFNHVSINDQSLSTVSALTYPYLQLRLNISDSVQHIPSQLNFWRINYQPVPEAAINPNAFFKNTHDTLLQGNTTNVQVAVENVSDYNMDTIWMRGVATNNKGISQTMFTPNQKLPAHDTIHAQLHYTSTFTSPMGNNTLFMDVNPFGAHHLTEQYHYNNIAFYYKLFLQSDLFNPIVDVTFDGVHILNNDIVSAKPDVRIIVKDENKFLPLNDTSKMKVYIQFPDNTQHYFPFDNVKLHYYLPTAADAANGKNVATLELKPGLLADGQYQLIVKATDISNNRAGKNDFNVGFQIINKPQISSMLNYPNPFTRSTRFIFTITGSEVPSFIKIQVLTITGKVVREIRENELGHLHIGRNITDYAWDGTDQYSQPLANGLYLYHVLVNNNGTTLDHYSTTADKWITNGFGKMYFMR